MLLTKNFGHSKYNIALGERILGLEDKISMRAFFYSDLMYLNYTNLQRVKEKLPLCVFYNIFPKRVVKSKKTCLMNKFINGGPLDSGHPVYIAYTFFAFYYFSQDFECL